MSQFKLPPKEKKPQYVKNQFEGIAEAYDQFNDWNSFFLHRHWKKKLVSKALDMRPDSKRVLDLCCGTGDIARYFSIVSPQTKIWGIDFSPGMLSYAQKKCQGRENILLEIGDAMDLKQVQSHSQDIVSMGFGLRNVADIDKCLGEVFRVLKPGGIFVNLDVGKVRIPWIRKFADFYFFKIVPKLGYMIFGSKNEMFDYLPQSSLTYPDQATLLLQIQKIGFQETGFENFVFGNVALHYAKKPFSLQREGKNLEN